MKRTLLDKIYKLAFQLKKYLGLAFVVFAALTQLSYKDMDKKYLREYSFLPSILDWANEHIVWLLLLGVFVGLCDWVMASVGSPKSRQGVEHCLNALQQRIFDAVNDTPPDLHRVTLFRRARWVWPWSYKWEFKRNGYDGIRWPWSGWLVPVARSGHAPGKSKTILFAPDGGDGGEGVAGYTWRCKNCIWIENLPTVRAGCATSVIQDYARATYSTQKWVKQRADKGVKLARSICGIPIEVDSKIWGVVIVDSQNTSLIAQEEIEKEHLMLAKLMEEFLSGSI